MKTKRFKGYCQPGRLIFLSLLFLLFIACNQKSNEGIHNEESPEVDPMEGVWKLKDQYWVKDGDTLLLGPDEIPVKHKIYLDGYVIWTTEASYDSLEWHGFGTYTLTNKTLIEKLVSMSIPMKDKMGPEDEIIYKIEFDKTICKQSTNTVRRGTIYLSVEEWLKLN